MADETEILLGQISTVTKIVRNTWLLLLLACGISWAFIAALTDTVVLLDTGKFKIPFVGTDARASEFLVGAPFALSVVMIYLHIMVARLWKLYARLPEADIDGLPKNERVEPWLGTALLLTDRHLTIVDWIACAASIVFIWVFPALTILAIGGSYIVASEAAQAYHTWMFAIAFGSTLFFFSLIWVPKTWWLSQPSMISAVAVAVVIIMALSLVMLSNFRNSDQRWLNITTWANPFISFRSVDLTGKSFDRASLRGVDFNEASGLNFSMVGAHAHGSYFSGAVMQSWRLYEADFSGSRFWFTDFGNSLLTNPFGPQTEATDFSGAFFVKSSLGNAVTEATSEIGIDFSGALIAGTFLRDWLAALMPNEHSVLQAAGIGDLFLGTEAEDASSRFATMSTSMALDGAAFRFFDPTNLWTVDVTPAFADGTVPHPQALEYDDATGGFKKQERPCHWTNQILNDEEFFAGWRWWRELNGLRWPPSDVIGDHWIARVQVVIDNNDPRTLDEASAERHAYRMLQTSVGAVSLVPRDRILVRDVPAKIPYGTSCS